jgi:hypothetical protein
MLSFLSHQEKEIHQFFSNQIKAKSHGLYIDIRMLSCAFLVVDHPEKTVGFDCHRNQLKILHFNMNQQQTTKKYNNKQQQNQEHTQQ